jgi:predicted  nucleic acid-binding Zn-ribbon protein
MEKLPTKKRIAIVRQYLSGSTYDDMAARNGVSKGTVANVVNELRAGRFPEAADVSEDIELLRELSLELKGSKLSPGQCATGLILLNRISECGLEPTDIGRWPMILKSVGNEDESREFVKLVYGIQEVQQRTGLSLNALDDKVHELERKAVNLEPVSRQCEDYQKQLAELTKKREELASSVNGLEEKYKLLNPRVKDLETREQTLSHRIEDMEPKAQKAETTLSTLNKEKQRLQDIGLSFEKLAGFNDRLQVIAQRHAIEPDELKSRLLHELETINKGLGLETLIQSRQHELDKVEQAVAGAQKELKTAKAVVGNLTQEKADLEAGIKETRERVSKEIAKLIPVAKETINRLGNELQRGNEEALAEVRQLRDEALEVGKEVGRYQGIVEVNQWLNDLQALVRGEESIEGKRVRVIALSVLRGVAAWLKRYEPDNIGMSTISLTIDNLIRELEQWKVQ